MPVEVKHKDLEAIWKKYVVIDDVLGGADAVKARATNYLPPPSGVSYAGAMADDRYRAYIQRAVFYAVAFHTLTGFVGEIFLTSPAIKLPPGLEGLEQDATGDGVSLAQLAKKACGYNLSKGRSGIFVDFPTRGNEAVAPVTGDDSTPTETTTPAPVTKAEAPDMLPVLTVYDGAKIINWRKKKFGSETLITLVVLEEEYDAPKDEFGGDKKKRYRVLRLSDDKRYSVQLYEKSKPGVAFFPTKGDGKPFDYIPFLFMGSATNDDSVDYPPLYDLCDLNIAHYRNSADYEEAAFLVGQPTLVVAGLTEQWAATHFSSGIGLGSRAALPLPVGATAELLSVTETTMVKEAMEHKERQMASLGAKLTEQKTVQRTATETTVDAVSEKSILSTVADNTSQAFLEALKCAADFVGATVTDENTQFKLNNEFSINLSTPEAVQVAITLWQGNAISRTEMRDVARAAGYATQPDDEAKKEIDKQLDEGLDREVSRMEKLTPLEEDGGKPTPPTE